MKKLDQVDVVGDILAAGLEGPRAPRPRPAPPPPWTMGLGGEPTASAATCMALVYRRRGRTMATVISNVDGDLLVMVMDYLCSCPDYFPCMLTILLKPSRFLSMYYQLFSPD
jgi:hypothetical protein